MIKNIIPVITIISLGILAIPSLPFFILFAVTSDYLNRWIDEKDETIQTYLDEHY